MAEEIAGKADAAKGEGPAPEPDQATLPMSPVKQAAAPAKSVEPEPIAPLRFEFTGTGAEYFRIWVVNILLTILTVGIYSAWAKVRRLQYFYRNTRLDGAIFDYHGNPKAILKGRILALVLLGLYKFSFDISIYVAIMVAIMLAAIMPWLLARSFRFKLAYTSYRGVPFRFQGTVAMAYRTLILFPVVLTLTGLFVWSVVTSYSNNLGFGVIFLGILILVVLGGTVPLAHYLLKRYQHDNAYFGQTPFFFFARPAEFFNIYGKAIAFFVLGSIVAAILGRMFTPIASTLLATPLGWLFQIVFGFLSFYVLYLFVRPYLESRIQNLIWNKTELGDHRFESTASARKLLWIHASNLLLITLTLGLYKPFAAIRLAKYRLENLALIPHDVLEEFMLDPEADQAGALGQEAGDLFDIDIAI